MEYSPYREVKQMSESALRLKEQVLQLSEEDRVELARVLWDSVECPEDEIDAEDSAWIAELNRRADDLAAGRAIAEPADQVMSELREECLHENKRR
jgi:putative addiction module component (TIGR02574 family)